MIKIEVLKELLKINLEVLGHNTSISGLTIDFKGDEFLVLDENKNVVFKDSLKNYDLDFESQKKFILDVANSVTSFVEVLENVNKDDLIRVDNEYFYSVIGKGDIYKKDNYININKLDNEKDNVFLCFIVDIVSDIILDGIKNNLDENKIRVILYSGKYGCEGGFYVGGVINDNDTYVYFIEDNVKKCNIVDLFYSNATTKEVEGAVKFIKELLNLL